MAQDFFTQGQPAAQDQAVSPPPAPVMLQEEYDPRVRLAQLAVELTQKPDRQRLAQYLKLRRLAQ